MSLLGRTKSGWFCVISQKFVGVFNPLGPFSGLIFNKTLYILLMHFKNNPGRKIYKKVDFKQVLHFISPVRDFFCLRSFR